MKGLTLGIFGPALIDLAEIYNSKPDDIALVISMRAFGTLVGSLIGEYMMGCDGLSEFGSSIYVLSPLRGGTLCEFQEVTFTSS